MKKAKKVRKPEQITVIDSDWSEEIVSEPEDRVDRGPEWAQTPLVPSRKSHAAVTDFQGIQGCSCSRSVQRKNVPVGDPTEIASKVATARRR